MRGQKYNSAENWKRSWRCQAFAEFFRAKLYFTFFLHVYCLLSSLSEWKSLWKWKAKKNHETFFKNWIKYSEICSINVRKRFWILERSQFKLAEWSCIILITTRTPIRFSNNDNWNSWNCVKLCKKCKNSGIRWGQRMFWKNSCRFTLEIPKLLFLSFYLRRYITVSSEFSDVHDTSSFNIIIVVPNL